MTQQPATTDPPPAPRRARRIVRVILAVTFVAALAWVLAGQWEEVRPLLGEMSPWAVGGAGVAVLTGIFATFLCWRALLVGLGYRLPLTGAMRVFFVGQLGKYLPGSVWPVMAQMELGRDYRVPPRASGAAVVVFMLVIVLTGLAVAVPTLTLVGGGALERYWWTLLALPVALVVAVPAVLNRLIGTVLRLARREPMPRPLPGTAIGRAAGWSLAAWGAYGVHLWLLARQFEVGGGARSLLVYVGAFAAAWTIGFLVVVAPAGAGAREAVLILLLAGALSTPQATAVAVVSRVLFTVGDMAWCLPVLVSRRRDRRARSVGADRGT